MKGREKIRYYSDFDFDFEKTKNQDYSLPENYAWIRSKRLQKATDRVLYSFAHIISGIWCRAFLRMKVHKSAALTKSKEGGFIYANHTQPVGDVFMPAHISGKRIRTVVSPSNLGIPVIGKLLPALGALPVPKEISRLKDLEKAITKYLNDGNMLVIYPERHVWKYYSGIRPFSQTAFMYPIKTNKPSFSLTTVYKKTKLRKKPRLHLYVDGPFFADECLPTRERYRELCQRIQHCMEKRCAEGDCEYIKYVYEDEKCGYQQAKD